MKTVGIITEYNPLHNHNGCDVSGVIYLKTPDTKGRRNIESKKGKDDNDGDITFVHSAMGQRNHDFFGQTGGHIAELIFSVQTIEYYQCDGRFRRI